MVVAYSSFVVDEAEFMGKAMPHRPGEGVAEASVLIH
jgi:hypothetical protein